MAMMKRSLSWLVLIVLLTLAGCGSKPATQEAYLKDWNRVMKHYDQVAGSLPEPNITPGMSREQKKAELVRVTAEGANRFAPLADEVRALHPPKQMQKLHDLTIEFFDGQAQRLRDYSRAIDSGAKVEVGEAGDEMDRFVLAQMQLIVDELGRLGGDATKFRDDLRKALQSGSR